jgi:hypothetical protein
MAVGKYPLYKVFDSLGEVGLRAEDLATLRTETKELVETLISGDIGSISEVCQGIEYAARLGMPRSQEALIALRSCVKHDGPSLHGIKLVLSSFRLWYDEAKPSVRSSFLNALPQLSPSVCELGKQGMLELVQKANSLASEDESRCLLEMLGRYGSPGASAILGVSAVAHTAISLRVNEYLERLERVAPPAKVRRAKGAAEMIKAAAHLTEVSAEHGQVLWCELMDLIFELSSRSYESASFAAKNLPKKIKEFSREDAVLYVRAFHRLAKAMGIRIVGYGLNVLPGIFAKHGIERAVNFVNSASLVADTYGVTAGDWFLERKTVAAKEALSTS